MTGIWSLEDESEREFWREHSIHSNEILLISYRDAYGNLTERTISVVAYEEFSGILAYCQKRKAIRNFLFDRIESCTDTKTGETIKRDQVFNFLFSFYQKTPEYSAERFIADHSELFNLIVYFLDIRILPHQQCNAIYREICAKGTGDQRITISHAREILCDYEATSERGFKQRIGKLRNNTDIKYRMQIMKLIVAIAKTLKPLRPEEIDALKYMRKSLFTGSENKQMTNQASRIRDSNETHS